MTKKTKRRWKFTLGFVTVFLAAVMLFRPSIGAALILHPLPRSVPQTPPGCEEITVHAQVLLTGWRSMADTVDATGARIPWRGSLIYLHGLMDNRGSSATVIPFFRKHGFDVVAYDSRAHGNSGGSACTYGYLEKEDLQRVLDTLKPGPIVLLGSSLGAAVALQTAAIDPRITAVVAAETFSDFRTVAAERAPFFFSANSMEEAFQKAEKEGQFVIAETSPMLAAKTISQPVLLIHGAEDTDTKPAHSQRVYEALTGPKRLILVPGAGHNASLSSAAIWTEIEQWINSVLTRAS